MDTKLFKTKQVLWNKTNRKVKGFYGVALDIGYSAVKGIGPDMVYCFPSYAKPCGGNERFDFGCDDTEVILYRGEDGEIWSIGAYAQDMVERGDTNDTLEASCDRYWFLTPKYLVLFRVGLAFGARYNPGEPIKVQTGLPPAYMGDRGEYVDALIGDHRFSIKVGNGEWEDFEISLTHEDIFVIPQPIGTLYALVQDNHGRVITEALNKFMNARILIVDGGFGTLDEYDIAKGTAMKSLSLSNLGMKRVLQETINCISQEYNTEVSVPEMQKVLGEGGVRVLDRKRHKSAQKPISQMLSKSSTKVCTEALQKMDADFNYLIDHNYLILTGGTSGAWKHHIKDYYKDMETLQVVYAADKTKLPIFFANVEGYYTALLFHLDEVVSKLEVS